MNRVSSDSRAQWVNSDPLIWIAVDSFRHETTLPRTRRSSGRTLAGQSARFGKADQASPSVIVDKWHALAGDRAMPAPEQITDAFLADLWDRSITFDLVSCADSDERKLEVRFIGRIIAQMTGLDQVDIDRGEAAALPLLVGLQTNFSEVFERCQPASFEIQNRETTDTAETYQCIVMPFGEKQITSIVAVIAEPGRKPEKLGEDVLDLDASTIVDNPPMADDADILELEHSAINRSAREEKPRAAKPAAVASSPTNSSSLSSLLDEARKSASLAREAEEQSRRAERQALSRTYDIVLALMESPEEFAAQLLCGESGEPFLSPAALDLLRQARKASVRREDLGRFLEDRQTA